LRNAEIFWIIQHWWVTFSMVDPTCVSFSRGSLGIAEEEVWYLPKSNRWLAIVQQASVHCDKIMFHVCLPQIFFHSSQVVLSLYNVYLLLIPSSLYTQMHT
jgi:hypothetical protein